jgi:hypothetical protein
MGRVQSSRDAPVRRFQWDSYEGLRREMFRSGAEAALTIALKSFCCNSFEEIQS